MLRPRHVKLLAASVLVLVAAGCGGATSTAQQGAPLSDELCATAAEQWGGTVAAAITSTVAEVRAYRQDPDGPAQDPTAPRPGVSSYPAGWEGLDDDAPAAACYLDGPVPKGPPPASDGSAQPSFDRRVVIAAQGVPSLMIKAGYAASMPVEPLPAGTRNSAS